MKKIRAKKTIYICDPSLNKKCSKTMCAHEVEGGKCIYTTNKKYALIGTNPIKVEELVTLNETV